MKNICEICHLIIKCDTHHIQSKSKSGSNHPSNLVRLCPNCHRRVHTGDIIIEGKFLSTLGYKLLWHRSDDENFAVEREPEVYLI